MVQDDSRAFRPHLRSLDRAREKFLAAILRSPGLWVSAARSNIGRHHFGALAPIFDVATRAPERVRENLQDGASVIGGDDAPAAGATSGRLGLVIARSGAKRLTPSSRSRCTTTRRPRGSPSRHRGARHRDQQRSRAETIRCRSRALLCDAWRRRRGSPRTTASTCRWHEGGSNRRADLCREQMGACLHRDPRLPWHNSVRSDRGRIARATPPLSETASVVVGDKKPSHRPGIGDMFVVAQVCLQHISR
jgi:hypothetical protein